MGLRIASPVSVADGGPQYGQRDLEGRRDVLLVDNMRGAQAFVRRSDEASAGSDVFLQGDTNRFIHEESEFAEKPVQHRALPRDREDKGTVGFHGLSLDTATCFNPPPRDGRKGKTGRGVVLRISYG